MDGTLSFRVFPVTEEQDGMEQGISGMVDTHCHLDEEVFAQDFPLVLARAKEAGVERMVVPGYSPHYWNRLQTVTALHRDCLSAAYGLHPAYAGRMGQGWLAELQTFLGTAVAVGEIGLDGSPGSPPPDRQKPVLEAQLELARRMDLPVILHARGATEALLQMLRSYRGIRGVIHSFSGSPEQAGKALDLGLYLGVGGAITHDRALRLRRTIRALPAESILLETDAPYQPPSGYGGRRNEPAFLPQTLRCVAALRGEAAGVLAGRTAENARFLFCLRGQS